MKQNLLYFYEVTIRGDREIQSVIKLQTVRSGSHKEKYNKFRK